MFAIKNSVKAYLVMYLFRNIYEKSPKRFGEKVSCPLPLPQKIYIFKNKLMAQNGTKCHRTCLFLINVSLNIRVGSTLSVSSSSSSSVRTIFFLFIRFRFIIHRRLQFKAMLNFEWRQNDYPKFDQTRVPVYLINT